MQIIDAHQHYWKMSRGDYSWMGPPVAAIMRDFLPEDMRPLREAAGIRRTVLVQAADTLAETEFMLDLAEADASIAGVVGWVDLDTADAVATLERLARRPKFRGIRPMLQDIADTFDILKPNQLDALSHLPRLGLTFDALAQPRHLAVVAALADRFPHLPIVVDHCAKPFIARAAFEPWASDMAAVAQRPNVTCKLSGMANEAGAGWTVAMLRPYAAHVLQSFGPGRVMFGSDWPVLTLVSEYARWWDAAHELTAHLTTAERAEIFGGTAARFYRI